MAQIIGVSYATYQQMEKGIIKKAEGFEKLKKTTGFSSTQENMYGIHNSGSAEVNNEHEKSSPGTENFYMDTITDLRQIGVKLSNANEETAITNRVLAENQRDLIEVLKKMHQPTADAARGSQDLPELKPVLVRIAKMGVPKYWQTQKEGMQVLGKFLSGFEFLGRE